MRLLKLKLHNYRCFGNNEQIIPLDNIFYYTKIFIKNLANFQQVYHKNMLDLEFPHKLFVIIYDNIQKIAFNHIFKITISSSHIAELLAHLLNVIEIGRAHV